MTANEVKPYGERTSLYIQLRPERFTLIFNALHSDSFERLANYTRK
jgi:hypothetical protein